MNALPPSTATRLVASPAVQSDQTLVARAVPAQESQGIVMQPVMLALLAVVFLALGVVIAKVL